MAINILFACGKNRGLSHAQGRAAAMECASPLALSVGRRQTQSARGLAHSINRAFTLLELLVVVAIMGLVAVFALPAVQSLNSANGFTSAAYGVAGMLERARAYAMANNLYVYVGIAEVDANVSASTVPQTAATATAGGRVAMAAVAARDGTRGYTMLSLLSSPAWASYNNGSSLMALGKLEVFENVHLAALGTPPASGTMFRPMATSSYVLANAASKSVTPFAWPLGSALNAGQYNFDKVVQFDPQGTARMQFTNNQDDVVHWMEIGLQQTHGSGIPAPQTTTGTIAAVLIDCMTGSVRVYRP